MAYYTTADAYAASARAERASPRMEAKSILKLSAANARDGATFDVFLSHSLLDQRLVLGAKTLLEENGQTVYVDWIDDAGLDRGDVSPATADILRNRMRNCRSLVYASSPAATRSRWMPWELGFFDGLRGNRIAIMPLVPGQNDAFPGQEYLGLYPALELVVTSTGTRKPLAVRGTGTRRQYAQVAGLVTGNPVYRAGP